MQIYRRPTLFFEGGCIPKIQIAPKIFRDRKKTTVYLLLLHSPEAHNDDDQRHPGGAQECQDALFAQVDLWWAHLFKVGVGHEQLREL